MVDSSSGVHETHEDCTSFGTCCAAWRELDSGMQQDGDDRGGPGAARTRRARRRSMNRFWFSRFLGLPDPGGARVPLEAFGATMSYERRAQSC